MDVCNVVNKHEKEAIWHISWEPKSIPIQATPECNPPDQYFLHKIQLLPFINTETSLSTNQY